MTRRAAHALVLHGGGSDRAALDELCRLLPDAPRRPWTELRSEDAPNLAAVTSPALDDAIAESLRGAGASVTRVARSARGFSLSTPGPEGAPLRWTRVAARECAGLLEAVRPRAARADSMPDEAIFLSPAGHPCARVTLDRLLALGRDDAAAHALQRDGERWLALRVKRPPAYLLLRARDEPSEGVVAYARCGAGRLWVRWGFEHPLADVASISLQHSEIDALVDSDGRWMTLASSLPSRSLDALISPRFEAPRVTLRASDELPRFTVTLRLEGADARDAEAWVLSADALLGLESLVESLAEDELRRFTLCRLDGGEGALYLLRELARPGQARLAPRVSASLRDPGFSPARGVEGLYLRAGTRLVPPLRPETLRSLFELDRARITLVDRDHDGPKVVAVRAEAEWSLADWVELVATDHRRELDRLAESSVFDWLPEHSVAPEPARDLPPSPPPPRAEPTPSVRRTPSAASESLTLAARDPAVDPLGELERERATGPRDDAAAWMRLGARKAAADELDDACACIEGAIFYGGLRADAARALLDARTPRGAPHTLDSLAARERLGSIELAELGAQALARLADPGARPIDDATTLRVTQRFAEPDAPVSLWLAWSVLRAAHGARRDAIELTRAKERLLGALNERGLREAVDLPRFIRGALAATTAARSSGANLRALEGVIAALDEALATARAPLGAYACVIFAAGFTRLAAPLRARELYARAVDGAHPLAPVNRVLIGLYRAHASHGADPARWSSELSATLDSLRGDARTRDRVEHLRKRSEWLGASASVVAQPRLRPALLRVIDAIEASPGSAPELLAEVMSSPAHYDFELVAAIERGVDAVLRSGDEPTLRALLGAITARVEGRLTASRSRAGALGACLRAAASIDDHGSLDALIEEVVALVETPSAHAHDLLDAVAPALAALRRLGGGPQLSRLLQSLSRVAAQGAQGATRIRAAVVTGLWQLGEAERATDELDRCIDAVLSGDMPPEERYQSARDLLRALRHAPIETRARCCEAIARGIDRFDDTFTAGQAGLYETHKILILERIVDTLADEVTLDGDALRALLDEEELAVRRRVRADWRERCGP